MFVVYKKFGDVFCLISCTFQCQLQAIMETFLGM